MFIAACESILLYGSESLSMTKAQKESLDGTYTKMLRMVLGISWKDKVSNDVLDGKLPKLSDAGDYNWWDTALGILNFWQII